MNWETYKTLTRKQKEEFEIRFKNEVPIPFPYMFSSSIIIILLIVVLNFSVYLIVTNPDLEKYQSNVLDIFLNSAYMIFVVAWVMVGTIIEYLVRVIIRSHQYSKWKKDNNIKEIFWYSKWLK